MKDDINYGNLTDDVTEAIKKGNYIPVYTNHNMECFRNIQKRRLPKWKSSFNVMSIIFSKFILIFFEKVL